MRPSSYHINIECFSEPPEDQHITQNTTVQQEVKPSFIRRLNDLNVYEGQKVTLQVEVAGKFRRGVCLEGGCVWKDLDIFGHSSCVIYTF